MSSVNKVILVGRLGQDPELRYTGSGTAVCNFSVATDESYTDRDGNRQEDTEWHRVVCWAKLAEICDQYLSKGSQVYIEGSLQTNEWEDRDGNKRYTTEVKARNVQFLDSKGDAKGNTPTPGQGRRERQQGEPQKPQGAGSGGGDDFEFGPDDDLPF